MMRINERGFTLIELLVVGIVITIMAAVALPRMDFLFGRNKLRTSTSAVTSSLYIARMKAVNDGEDYGVQFSEDGVFQIVRDPLGVYEVTSISNHLEEGIEINDITFIDWLAIFNSFGQLEKSCLSSGDLTGSIILNNDTGDTTRIDVTFVTGRIRETNL